MHSSGPEVCPGTGESARGLVRPRTADGDDRPTCPICDTPQYTWPHEGLDALFVLHRYPGPILCAGSGLPARMVRAECAMCPHPAKDHPHGTAYHCAHEGCACPALIFPNRCGLCGHDVETSGGDSGGLFGGGATPALAVAHARPGT